MKTRHGLLTVLAWLQMLLSLLLAVAIVWGYFTYQSSLGQFIRSTAASIGAISNVVSTTTKTVETRRDLMTQSAQMLAESKRLVVQLRGIAENQAKDAPRHAEGVQSAASTIGKVGGLVQKIGEGMMFSVPSGMRLDGMKPVITMSRPLEAQAKEAMEVAQEIKSVSTSFSILATTISRDALTLSVTLAATSDQALKVISEADKALTRFNAQDLPKAVEELNNTAKHLKDLSEQVDIVSNLGVVLLLVGLILALWCFLNSLGSLMLTYSRASAHKEA